MSIRSYDPSDEKSVLSLWDDVFNRPAGHNDVRLNLERKIAAEDSLLFVAMEANTVVGTVMVGYDGHRGWIYSLAVHPEHRRQGIGTQLMRHAEAALVERGCPKINLQVLMDNAAVVAFYESLGFRTEPRISMGKLLFGDRETAEHD